MGYPVDIVVTSNISRELGPDVQVIVGLPDNNPLALPFAHKKLFSERVDHYDLFIYSEDDILITKRNIEAFQPSPMCCQTTRLPVSSGQRWVRPVIGTTTPCFLAFIGMPNQWSR